MLILFPDNDRKMFHNSISQLLWKTLWRMWKTPGYSQAFWLFRKHRPVEKRKWIPCGKWSKPGNGRTMNGVHEA